ncbi:spermatogenesis-associated serine-rich protein 2 [Triplophysa dalaica]|uniref:spermatogenesis-associated serine-rich protein 2 n=1 Tax=Triplophysa dalaica TaxID=1582913 RepID=UPI0024E01AEF|nr:spermatogenesis-associated serine-rich protein 2 [Triplophysa dalaica]XP_056585547.1 spermatogenesis-associated serine-rich protein 2 [Triplophysa dalaica]XP_056585549.1 spermatogenesis-associated serine-rich protein 2 [Triplophysa dalaica]XP_056585550.1 spermatogenesis-associated serine-rich protein 2 [Triplophysa dalaica]XP_056585551.1 spermatogenesis-associated serine-rich protein 2 [Triplophysa dalaica]
MMAKKSSGKDVSGVVFDTHSKVVMSQGGTFEKMKEKINAVRAVVPNKSNNEITLVLQHFENCVDRAVQAFVEGSAVEILKEWNVTGKKKPKKKKKPKPQTEAPVDPAPADSTPDAEGPEPLNGFHANGSADVDGDSIDSLSEQLDSLDKADLGLETAAPELSEATGGEGMSNPTPSPTPPHTTGNEARQNHPSSRSNKSQVKSVSSYKNSSVPVPSSDTQQGSSGRKIGANVDRSVKDLQRCAASLTRYRVVVRDEMDSSIKKMKQTFAELQSCLMDREVTLFAEMDKVKAEAMAILDGRQKRAEELKRLTDQSASLKEEQLTELRAEIKHFVSERKYDEDLGKAVKFSFDIEPLKCSITSFGSVYHPQTSYSSRSRCSSTSSSVTSSTSEIQPQPSAYMARSNVPHKQIFQGNRRIIQGYQGNPRYNGNGNQDRNPGRTNSRYQGDRYHGDHRETPNSQPANSVKSPSHLSANRPDQPSHNGLPQRQPRSHCL